MQANRGVAISNAWSGTAGTRRSSRGPPKAIVTSPPRPTGPSPADDERLPPRPAPVEAGIDPDVLAAAAFLDRLDSGRIAQESASRLHYGGQQSRREALRQAEAAAYPPEPRVMRSAAETARHVELLHDRDMERRRMHRAALDRAIHGQGPQRALSPTQQRKFVKRMHDQQEKKRKKHAAAVAERTAHRPPPPKDDAMMDRELGFRPAVGDPKRDDHKRILTAPQPPTPYSVAVLGRPPPAETRVIAPEVLEEHLGRLARPFDHKVGEKLAREPPSDFSVYTKYR